MRSKYKCLKCKNEFEATHFKEHRFATGRTITCCGEPALWRGNIESKAKDSYNVWLTSRLGDNIVRINADSENEARELARIEHPNDEIRFISKLKKVM